MMILLFLVWQGLYLMEPRGILQIPRTVNIIVKDKTSKDSIESISIILSLQLQIMMLMPLKKINSIRIKLIKITQIISLKILKICLKRSIKGTKQIIKVIKIKVDLQVTLPKPCLHSIVEELAHIIDQIPWSTKRINKMIASIATISVLLTKTKSRLRYRRWVTRSSKLPSCRTQLAVSTFRRATSPMEFPGSQAWRVPSQARIQITWITISTWRAIYQILSD